MPEAGYLPIPKKLARAGVKDMVRISDARMSGTAYGAVVLHVTPDAATGGPLALVETGDRIRAQRQGAAPRPARRRGGHSPNVARRWKRRCRASPRAVATTGSTTPISCRRTRAATSTSARRRAACRRGPSSTVPVVLWPSSSGNRATLPPLASTKAPPGDRLAGVVGALEQHVGRERLGSAPPACPRRRSPPGRPSAARPAPPPASPRPVPGGPAPSGVVSRRRN